MRTLAALIAALFLVSTGTFIVAQQVRGEDLFQQALAQERGKRDIAAAIRIYERILREFSPNSALMARTLTQLGDCYEKQGQQLRAQDYYRQVIDKYPAQTEMVGRAKSRLGPPATPLPSHRIEFELPQGMKLAHAFRNGVDISPDGRRIAFVASTAFVDLGDDPKRMIYVKSLDDFSQTTPVRGTEAGYNPFFSPDGEWLGFFAGLVGAPRNAAQTVAIMKVRVSGGTPVVVATLKADPNQHWDNLGATWGSNGTIVIGGFQDGLKWIPQEGGEPKPLTHLDAGANEVSHRLPHFLPEGSGILFTVMHDSPHAVIRPQIWVALRTGRPRLVLDNGTDARFAGNRLIFARSGKLFGVAFDAQTFVTTGSPVALIDDGVVHATNYNVVATRTGTAQYSVSQNGALLYAAGSVEPLSPRSVVWVDRTGVVELLPIPAREYVYARLSPDGTDISLASADGLWIYDTTLLQLRSQLPTRTGPAEWSLDGSRFAFNYEGRAPAVRLKDINSSSARRLLEGYALPTWSADGRELAVQHETAGKNAIAIVDLAQPEKIRHLLHDPQHNYTYPVFSPDGSWLAYCSDESGSYQVYVQPYPGPGPRVRVSSPSIIDEQGRHRSVNTRATQPAWARDGSQLFYTHTGHALMMSVRFRVADGQFVPETPIALFRNDRLASTLTGTVYTRSWDVGLDGRFVMIRPEPEDTTNARLRRIFPSTLALMAPGIKLRPAPQAAQTTSLLGPPREGPLPDFSGRWTNTAPGGVGFCGQECTITQDATSLTVTRMVASGGQKTTYKLDGSESKNPGRGGQDVVSRAMWDGNRLRISTQVPVAGGGTASFVFSMNAGQLEIEASIPGGSDGARKQTYKRN